MESFADKYKRQDGGDLCSTIVAHLQKDGLSFIHPKQNRSLTPREAARIQSFPDNFLFSGQRGNVYHQIGNAVPPLAGRAIGYALEKYLKHLKNSETRPTYKDSDKKVAFQKLDNLVNSLSLSHINEFSTKKFMEIWNSVHIIHPTLHPQNALEESKEKQMYSNEKSLVYAPFDKASGWPFALIPIAQEAFNRFQKGELSETEFYFNSVQKI
jgi:DNA (cytosine-5)-methyltransferase 1